MSVQAVSVGHTLEQSVKCDIIRETNQASGVRKAHYM